MGFQSPDHQGSIDHPISRIQSSSYLFYIMRKIFLPDIKHYTYYRKLYSSWAFHKRFLANVIWLLALMPSRPSASSTSWPVSSDTISKPKISMTLNNTAKCREMQSEQTKCLLSSQRSGQCAHRTWIIVHASGVGSSAVTECCYLNVLLDLAVQKWNKMN